MGLQRVLGLKSNKTAWALLHKLRHAMVRLNRDWLSLRVEADETYLGGVEEGGDTNRPRKAPAWMRWFRIVGCNYFRRQNYLASQSRHKMAGCAEAP